MHSTKKTLLDMFQEHITCNYSAHCKAHNKEKSPEGLLTFLIDKGLIPSPQIRRFTIKEEFQKQFPTQKDKTQTIRKLSDFFHVSERHIWGILKYEDQLKKKKLNHTKYP